MEFIRSAANPLSDWFPYVAISLVDILFQTNNYWMDGAAYASQCPISKYSTFKYVFKAEYEGYWYHSHNGIQRIDGLFGGLTIYDPGNISYFFKKIGVLCEIIEILLFHILYVWSFRDNRHKILGSNNRMALQTTVILTGPDN